jgi:orotate phosphoribosyltransferase
MIEAADIARALEARGALLQGHFLLSSGRHSDRFIQKFRILERPDLLEPVARAIAQHFAPESPSIVVSAAVGGILLGYEVARALGTSAIFVERENGRAVLRRGFRVERSDRVLVVDDVITTGGSVRDVIDVVRSFGAAIVGVGAIVSRGDADVGAPTYVLLDLPLRSYDRQNCPMCAAGEPIVDPGSRRV